MFGVGYTELLVIGIVGVLLFGHRLPKIMRDLGRGITEFKHGLHDIRDTKSDGIKSEGGYSRWRRKTPAVK